MRKGSSRTLLAALCFLLVIGPASLFFGKQASAQIMRVAVVQSLKGGVTVLKSGGAKPFKAFKNMSLNEGDQIATAKDGQVVLELSSANADKDSITIAANSVVNFSKMKDGEGTKSKLSVWAGSLWVKVKSVSNASDQFEVETPTSIMGVRGTQFYVDVDPMTGLTQLFLAAGVVQSSTNDTRKAASSHEQMNQQQLVYPSQQLAESHDQADLMTQIAIVDLQQFIAQASPDIIRAILSSAQSIMAENDAYLLKKRQELDKGPKGDPAGSLASQEELDRIAENLGNLLSAIAQEALKQQKLDQKALEQLVEEAGKKLDGSNIIDLKKKADLKLTDKEKEQQNKLDQLLKAKQEQAAKEQAAKEAQLQQMKDALAKAQQKLQELIEQNRKKLEEQQKLAEQAYFNTLSADEQKKFNANRVDNGLAPLGTGTSPGAGSGPVQQPAVRKASLAFSNPQQAATPVDNIGDVDLNLVFDGFAASPRIAGYQIEVEFPTQMAAFRQGAFAEPESALQYRAGAAGFKVEPEGTSVANANSVDDFRVVAGSATSSVIYSVAMFRADPATVPDSAVMLKLPFNVHAPSAGGDTGSGLANVAFHIKSIKAVDANGDPIAVKAGDDVTVQVRQANT
ncbi:hypothetical protein GXP70_19785 [Paenibacillus lycopersici]|uniref:FecR protein domain-containing protein n=1 Tax=Paenibacillus lycopersici TaxID=2704462 RepID=A0A6C0G505_9BACL|nr:FecR domain-containing protein [Paenibacillus lycopersici]QHT62000.1 hypothetical protein GXP70_19785 [Paenibacillus lycopersici]